MHMVILYTGLCVRHQALVQAVQPAVCNGLLPCSLCAIIYGNLHARGRLLLLHCIMHQVTAACIPKGLRKPSYACDVAVPILAFVP